MYAMKGRRLTKSDDWETQLTRVTLFNWSVRFNNLIQICKYVKFCKQSLILNNNGLIWAEWGGGVRSGPNRKCDKYPWFDAVPGRSCLLPMRSNFSVEYCLGTVLQVTLDYVQKWQNGSETTVCNAINKWTFRHPKSCKPPLLQNSAATREVRHKFLSSKPENFFKQRGHGANHPWVCTNRFASN